ncbi:acyclic terpene utilization AtuA family protein [Desertimonas flava]|uniref:acyclic terpene utilization AtuA family protein n=1 Tax=Desertimonas flava TaxID=2064846 RepID=UPI000E3549C9|nr:acyclic terpene utilization AtuA family protein [Desertimonas flava]
MARPIRIGNCSAFFGDRSTALAEIVAEPDLDVVTGDYLAEVTMLVLAKTRAKRPDAGYAASFLAQLQPAIDTIAERGIKVVTNAGGLNPRGLADAVGKLLAAAGRPLSVAVVDGDDVSGRLDELQRAGHDLANLRTGAPLATWPFEPLTANAYLGGWGIARALAAGADIVITGRVTDASVVVGPAAWWHGWGRDDLDQLAGAVVAGHLIECGTQVTGGNYSGFTTIGADVIGRPAFPIAEIAADGSSVVTKASGPGAVTVGTATAQLLYEIGAPAYLNPDVTAHFDTVRFEQVGPDRVAVSPVGGSAPPATTKVAITALGGFRNQYTNVITGLDVEAKAAWYESAVRAAVESADGVDALTFERLGTVADDPADQGAASMIVRTTVTGTEQGVGRPFGAAIVELALANIPGFYGLNLPGAASSFGTYWPGLLEQSALDHRVTLPDGSVEHIEPPPVAPPSEPEGIHHPEASGEYPPDVREAPLGLVADARSGDKGGDANVGVWVRELAHWPWLRDTLTVDVLRRLLPEAAGLDIDHYELPLVGALNFVVHDLLGDGATANVRADNQAKALGEYLRAKHVPIPVDYLPARAPAPGTTPVRQQGAS